MVFFRRLLSLPDNDPELGCDYKLYGLAYKSQASLIQPP